MIIQNLLQQTKKIVELQDELKTLDDYKRAVLEAKVKEKENGIQT